MQKPLVLTPRAARWLYSLLHTQGLGVQVGDLQAAAEAVAAVDRYVAQLPAAPVPTPQELVNGKKSR